MSRRKNQIITAAGISLAAIIIDQIIKIWVKTNMYMHEVIDVTPWFKILFTENRGMAFGMELMDKLFLTSFRIFAVAFLIYIIGKQIRQGIDYLFLVCLSLILAGAMGNILDCLFYGMVFNNPPAPLVAEFVPWGTGYDTIFYGRVVDMFYFPLVEWNWPEWLPFFGGEHFIFFSPIFNFADACISCGVIMVVLFVVIRCRLCLSSIIHNWYHR
jgi:signal peptidase II